MTSANSASTGTPVPPPHFDDEQTVQSARPVVPLEQINAKVRQRRQWFLGGAFAVAMMLGAASALVASYLRLRSTATANNEVPQVEAVTSAPLAATESVPETEQPIPVPAASPKPEAPINRRAALKRGNNLPGRRDTGNGSEDEQLERIREAVLYEEWQERRGRRATRRERRRLDDNHRDLSNLDEIFEGRRRRRDNPD